LKDSSPNTLRASSCSSLEGALVAGLLLLSGPSGARLSDFFSLFSCLVVVAFRYQTLITTFINYKQAFILHLW
jgi:hypothetical protein